MPLPVEILLCVLLLVLILAALRVYTMLGELRGTLASVEQTRQEITGTVQKLDRMMSEDIAPTLQVARQTLTNVEITTKALADTTLAARRITAKSEGMAQAAQLLLLGGSVAKQALNRKSDPDARTKTKSRTNSKTHSRPLAAAALGLIGLLTQRRTQK